MPLKYTPSVTYLRDVLAYNPDTGIISWRVSPVGHRPAVTGGQLLAETVAAGRRAAVRPKPAIGAASDPVA